ncbi:glycosyltransferase family 2 protein [Chryseobacterium koreense]|uniref:glycosyltransferase family 2 protein n=1 Tax=Chryseobacterium koreense TaxID=232216 RepID=UPI00065AEBF2|nr:glycosyltransferase [Chryseobacterium koreense]MBB5333536.1 glycosyltransferase involved in cell wall biosynthesis [Chryseobacterium koreense]
MDLSVIIPVYNVEKFLAKCLDSVLNTFWNGVTIEILLVNDGSPDGSLAIAEKYQQEHREIKIISQENKGLGGARNTGIKNASGNYLFFLDADDYLINDQLTVLVKEAVHSDLDILEFGAKRVDLNGNVIDEIFQYLPTQVLSAEQYLMQIDFANSACNKLYKRDFLLQNNITFFEKTWIEDAPFNIEAISKASKVKAASNIPVAYLQNPDSITRGTRALSAQRKFIEDSIKVTAYIDRFSNFHTLQAANLKIQNRVATFVAGILLYILKCDCTKKDKIGYVHQLSKQNLYPCHYKSPVLTRNMFLRFANNRVFTKLLGSNLLSIFK